MNTDCPVALWVGQMNGRQAEPLGVLSCALGSVPWTHSLHSGSMSEGGEATGRWDQAQEHGLPQNLRPKYLPYNGANNCVSPS